MSRVLSLLVALLFVFDLGLVAARPQILQSRSPTPIDVLGLNTNAKRFVRGLPPLPAFIKRTPTGVENARRTLPSQCAKSGVIQVYDSASNALIGYVSEDLKANQHYTLVGSTADAGLFSSTVSVIGTTSNINLLDVADGSHYLAGLIQQNQQLGDGSGDDKAAILGNSHSTNPGDTPQANKDPSWNNRDSETAIWSYTRVTDILTAQWVNYAGQTPSTVNPVHTYWLQNDNKFYLTSSSSPPQNGKAVYFKYVSQNDQCS